LNGLFQIQSRANLSHKFSSFVWHKGHNVIILRLIISLINTIMYICMFPMILMSICIKHFIVLSTIFDTLYSEYLYILGDFMLHVQSCIITLKSEKFTNIFMSALALVKIWIISHIDVWDIYVAYMYIILKSKQILFLFYKCLKLLKKNNKFSLFSSKRRK
jgi:hypothetical protein